MNAKLKTIIAAAALITGFASVQTIYADAGGHGAQGNSTSGMGGGMMGAGNMMNNAQMGDRGNMPGAGQMGNFEQMENFKQMGFDKMGDAEGMQGMMKQVAVMMQDHGKSMQEMLEAQEAETTVSE